MNDDDTPIPAVAPGSRPAERIASALEDLAAGQRASSSFRLWDELHTVERSHVNVRRGVVLMALLLGLLIGAALAERAARTDERNGR